MKETNHSMSRKTRTILIVAAILLACFVVVMAIVLIVPHGSSAERQEYTSIEAYNEEHGTNYLVPVIPDQTADLYTDRQTYLYSSGWYDLMLLFHFNYAGNLCDFYIQLDKDEDLASRENFAFLSDYNNFDERWIIGSADTEFRYRERNGCFLTKMETDDAIYYLSVETDNENLFFTVIGTVFAQLLGN